MELYRDSSKTNEQRVNDLLSKMTWEEKIAQLSSTIFGWGETNFPAQIEGDALVKSEDYSKATKHGLGGIAYLHMSLKPLQSARYANALQRDIIEGTRLGIPLFIFDECMHCQFAQDATIFPLPPALASSFDPDLVRRVFDVIGRESRLRGGSMCFSPHLDLARDPRWGRMSETFGEDVHLVSRMATAAVLGLQGGKKPDDYHIASAPKHFAGFAQVAGGRQGAPTIIPHRQLIDETLEPFRAVVQKAGAAAIMPAYCELDGIPCHSNKWLLTDMLRKTWGFEGVVASDFGGIANLAGQYGICKDIYDAAKMALLAGVDMDLPGGSCFAEFVKNAECKQELQGHIDISVQRVLELKFQLGLFDHPYVNENTVVANINTTDFHTIAVEAATKSITLLKNENALLPLDISRYKQIACIGPLADDATAWRDNPDPTESLYGTLVKKFGQVVSVKKAFGCSLTNHDNAPTPLPSGFEKTGKIKELPLSYDDPFIREAVALAEESDVIIACLGESGNIYGENFSRDRSTDRDKLNLIGNQEELLRALRKTGKPVILALFHGHTLAVPQFDNLTDALLDCWTLGEGRGEALVSVITGECNPGGRLPVTLPANVGQVPVYYSRKPGFFDSDYAFSPENKTYPFGFGLSYTTFTYNNIKLVKDTINTGETATVMIDVTNTGKIKGDETVQLYIKDDIASVSRPEIALKNFKRITLNPGEKITVAMDIDPECLMFTNVEMERVIEPGTFTIFVGPNSRDLIQKTILNVT